MGEPQGEFEADGVDYKLPLELFQNKESLAHEVVSLAKKIMLHPARPRIRKTEPMTQLMGEIALEETLEENWRIEEPESIHIEWEEDKRIACCAMLDCSSSMAGQKHFLASIAAAVLLLELEPRQSSLVLFSSDAKTIKPFQKQESIEQTLKEFLKTQPKGFTNIAKGLEEGRKELAHFPSSKKIGLLISDGRSTEGKDPELIAHQFHSLSVLHLHGPGSYLEGSQRLAMAGKGYCWEVEKMEQLPKKLYDSIRFLYQRS